MNHTKPRFHQLTQDLLLTRWGEQLLDEAVGGNISFPLDEVADDYGLTPGQVSAAVHDALRQEGGGV